MFLRWHFICLFIILFVSFSGWSQVQKKKKFFVPLISLKMTLSGDMSDSYQFNGPLGDNLKGEPAKPNPVCESHSSFQLVLYREKKSLQIWLQLKCMVNGETFEYRPQRFFADPEKSEQVLILPAQSEKFKKISVHLTELQIKSTPPKK